MSKPHVGIFQFVYISLSWNFCFETLELSFAWKFWKEVNCLTSAPCNISAAETFTVANKMMYYHCQRKVLYGPRCFLLVWDMLLMGVSSCLLPGRVLGSHVNPPPCKRNTFFFFPLISAALVSVHFSLISLLVSVTLGWLVWLLLKEFLLESGVLIASGCSCYFLNMSLLQSMREATVKSTHAQRGCSF